MAKLSKVNLRARRDSATARLKLDIYAEPGNHKDTSAMDVSEARAQNEYAAGAVFHGRLSFKTPTEAERPDVEATKPWLICKEFERSGFYEYVVLTLDDNVVAIAKVENV
jgi:hypothetical protein